MSFTKEELAAVSPELASVYPTSLSWICDGWCSPVNREYHECAVRLALAHPERAHLALGEGWESGQSIAVDDGSIAFVCWRVNGWPIEVNVHGQVWMVGWTDAMIPPEFPASLERAFKIAAALKRIKAAKA